MNPARTPKNAKNPRDPESLENPEPANQDRGYFRLSRTWPGSLVIIVPLLLVYEVGVLVQQRGAATAAGIVKGPLAFLGPRGMLVFNLVVVGAFIVAAAHLPGRRWVRIWPFPLMVLEALLYAVLMAPFIQLVLTGRIALEAMRLPAHVSASAVIVSAGAGVYEEFLFRGVLLGVLYLVFLRVFKLHGILAGTLAIVAAAAIFSAWHFLGPQADPVSAGRFSYRLIAGLVLSIIFLLRGMGITCYAHAIYNMIALGLVHG